MFDNVKIIRKKSFSAVYDGATLINVGSRPIDLNFADRVYNKMVEMQYTPITFRNETTFKKA